MSTLEHTAAIRTTLDDSTSCSCRFSSRWADRPSWQLHVTQNRNRYPKYCVMGCFIHIRMCTYVYAHMYVKQEREIVHSSLRPRTFHVHTPGSSFLRALPMALSPEAQLASKQRRARGTNTQRVQVPKRAGIPKAMTSWNWNALAFRDLRPTDRHSRQAKRSQERA